MAHPLYSLSYLHTHTHTHTQIYWRHSGSHENASGLRSSRMIDFSVVFSPSALSYHGYYVLDFGLSHGLIGACQRNCGLSALMFYHLGATSRFYDCSFPKRFLSRLCTGALLYPLVHVCFFFGFGWRFQGV
jgi:hypothetical protein